MTGASGERRRVRVLVVDDHPVSLLGLVAILGSHDDFEVVGVLPRAPSARSPTRRARAERRLAALLG